ncbi:VOC family protein [Leptobacterium flavescens]|uniref:VOC family protein n=1 Tax=Leptobacterium flavescens TaxID=472055 RepID=A0A6P0UN67_9FLAO|nr:VOC family protein [Leptobacterium flavescens]NER14724.1 VOC family protein [Leptobacterium flavescens]
MIHKLTHFAIYTEDIQRASKFYGQVFNWKFNDYGGTDFLQIRSKASEKGELIGALQDRKYSPLEEKVIGFECSIAVKDLNKTIATVQEAGGTILMPKTEIPHVGHICKFTDTEGNLLCAVQYHDHILASFKQA